MKRIISVLVALILGVSLFVGISPYETMAEEIELKNEKTQKINIGEDVYIEKEVIKYEPGTTRSLTNASQFVEWNSNTVSLKDKNNIEHKFLFDWTAPHIKPKSLAFEYRAPLNNNEYYFYIDTYKEYNGEVWLIESCRYNLSGGVDPGSIGTFFYYFLDYPKMVGYQDKLYLTFAIGGKEWGNYSVSKNIKIKNGFSDWCNHFGKKEILYGMQNKWVNETEEFRPNASITRAEFIKIVNKAFRFNKKSYDIPFKDVSSTDWWYSEVQIALGNGYISTGNENFRPRDPITRQEVANIITTITKTKDNNLDKLDRYTDKDLVSKSMKSSVEGSIEQGFMGVGSNTFNPRKNITRGEAIVTLYRVIKR